MRGLIIDTETTGLSHNYNQILTVGMLLAEIDDSLDFITSRHIKIKHDNYLVSGIAMKINKIDLKEHHKTAIDTKDACLEINNFIKKNRIKDIPMIGHNIGFDMRFLRELFKRNSKEFPLDLEVIDTRDLWINLKYKGIVSPYYKGNLRTIAEHFKVDYNKAHDAIEDCKITAQVFHKMLGVLKENKSF